MAHRPAATLSNVKGKRDAPSLPANVTCLHSTQTNRSEPTMCVSGMPGAQSCKCSCEVTFSQPKHSFVIMVATPFLEQRRGRGDRVWWRRGSCRAAHRIVPQSRATRHHQGRARAPRRLTMPCSRSSAMSKNKYNIRHFGYPHLARSIAWATTPRAGSRVNSRDATVCALLA